MVGCSILKCKSRSAKDATIRFFSFPKKEPIANEWLRYCGTKTTTINGRVCSNHFLSSDYFKPLRHVLLNNFPRNVRTLKPDAIPTLQIIDRDKQNSPHNIMAAKVIVKNEDTSNSMNCLSECNTVPVSSEVVKKRDETVTISLAEYELLKRTANGFHVLKNNLEKIFTSGQIRCLMKSKKRRVKWSAEDIAAAMSLRSISPKGYRHLRSTIGIPLPAFSTLRKWAIRKGRGVK